MPAVAVDLELVLTNATRSDVRVRVAGAVPKLLLSLRGQGAVDAPKNNKAHKDKLRWAVLKPGQKVSVPVKKLMTYEGSWGGTISHHWTEPGEYSLSASFYTALELDYRWGKAKQGKLTYVTLKAPAITLKVEK